MKTILVIEDERAERERACAALEGAGYKVISARDGQAGLDAAIHHPPDIIVSDIKLPKLDGYEVLDELSKNDRTKSIPFVFMSYLADRHEVRKGMDLGADDYLSKPVKESDLIKAVAARLARVEQVRR